jgi:signal transduction histidine kinase
VRPLDRLSSIKTKLGVVIVAAVAVTILVISIGVRLDIPLWITGPVAGALALAMVQFLAHGMTFPLRQMVAAARSMGRGDYSARVTATSRDEVGELARAFNRMASELAEVERMRRDLVANVSHELRTPISALQGVLENVIDGVETLDQATIQTMLDQVNRLGRLVAQLLDLSRLESGAVPLNVKAFKVQDLFEEAARESDLHLSGSDRKVRVELSVDPPGLELKGDRERVHQVVSNLLENAIRHSPTEGVVEVRADSSDGRVRIEVEDRGPGIADDDAHRVFERFYRTDAGRTASEGGSGLGLSIARWIVELHDGEIKIERASPHGCRMVVLLPT